MIGGSWGRLQCKVLRIGHMGVQASIIHLLIAITTLARALADLGYRVNVEEAIGALEKEFRD
jgi:alanine-glyoxylate transaminase/serine-glyoxylate transaminase/serine-pyruvate transaminase